MFLSVLTAQQRRTESWLRESEQRFRSLVDAMPVMVWMSDADTRCSFFNKTWLEFTGRHLEEDFGGRWGETFHPEDRENWIRHFVSAFHSRNSFVLEHRLLRNDGAYRWVLDHGLPRFGSDGQFLGYIGSCIDITDRKEAEDRLRQLSNQLMHSVEAERSRIGQELHDDLAQRAAMFSLRLSHLAQTPGKDVARHDLEELHQRASDLCRDIANISHRLRPVLLEKLGLVVALQDLCRQSTNDGQTVAWMGDEELPNVSTEVSIALYRIAQEAVRNATTHGGDSQIYVELRASQSNVTLTIRDTERGFNLSSTGKASLGLSGMAERIRSVGGHLEILSSPGNGTTVIATAPPQKRRRRITDEPTQLVNSITVTIKACPLDRLPPLNRRPL
jgi:PAS domain S-box-containing protein